MTATVAVKAVLAPGGITLSQAALAGLMLVLTAIGEPPLVIDRLCVAVSTPFTIKVSEVGTDANVGVGGGGRSRTRGSDGVAVAKVGAERTARHV